MGTQTLVNVASGLSGLLIITSLVTVGILFNDINSLYFEVLDDMVEFKVCSVFRYVNFSALSIFSTTDFSAQQDSCTFGVALL